MRPPPLPLPVLAPRRRLARRLRAGLEAGELEVHYQPKVQLDTTRPTGVEALLRWRAPAHGLVPPGRFLPMVEQHEVMEAVGAHVLESALAQFARWREDGVVLPVAVNASPANLLDPGLPATIALTLERHGVPPRALTLEITETAVVHDLDRCAAILRDVAWLGVGISLDDFGTGHSSLTRVLQLPIDELKIDRSFVGHMRRDSAAAAVVSAIVALAQDLGHRAVAEGVEDADTVERLAELGCDEAQGHHFSRALPAPELPAWALAPAPRHALLAG